MEEKKYYTGPEAAKLLGISRIAVFKQIKKGKIKAKKIGRNYAIERKKLMPLLNKTLSEENKIEIEKAVKRVIKDYGETLKLLAHEEK